VMTQSQQQLMTIANLMPLRQKRTLNNCGLS
jgi:hypothetical protein